MPSYVLNPHKHVKIWFSKDADVFLNPENQLRLLQFRTKNPMDEITFVFSKQLLSDAAQRDLFAFCDQHQIKPLSLEDIEPQLILTEEKQLMTIAKMELAAAQNSMGGNLAAASDIVRILSPVYKNGVYSDFDVLDINTSGLPDTIFVEAPLIANIGSTKIVESHLLKAKYPDINAAEVPESLFLNNDMLAIPDVNENLPEDEQQQAETHQQKLLSEYRANILASYQDIVDQLEKVSNTIKSQIASNPLLKDMENIIANAAVLDMDFLLSDIVIKAKPGRNDTPIKCAHNPIEYRHGLNESFASFEKGLQYMTWHFFSECGMKHFSELTKDLSKEATGVEIAISYLYKILSYGVLSGNLSLLKLFKDTHTIGNDNKEQVVRKFVTWAAFSLMKSSVVCTTGPGALLVSFENTILSAEELERTFAPFSFQGHSLLKNSFKSKNNVAFHAEKLVDAEEIGCTNNVSWTDLGRKTVQVREKKLHAAAGSIQRFFRKYQHEKQRLISETITIKNAVQQREDLMSC